MNRDSLAGCRAHDSIQAGLAAAAKSGLLITPDLWAGVQSTMKSTSRLPQRQARRLAPIGPQREIGAVTLGLLGGVEPDLVPAGLAPDEQPAFARLRPSHLHRGLGINLPKS